MLSGEMRTWPRPFSGVGKVHVGTEPLSWVVDPAWNLAAPRFLWSSKLLLPPDNRSAPLLDNFPLPRFPWPTFHFCNMSLLAVNTVDRLDRPSAYYVGKVGESTAAAWPRHGHQRCSQDYRTSGAADTTTGTRTSLRGKTQWQSSRMRLLSTLETCM